MNRGRYYDIFPRTWKGRTLLAFAFVAGLAVVASSVVFYVLTLDLSGDLDIFGDVEVTIENRTGRHLTIYLDGQSEAALPAGQTTSITTPKIQWRFGGGLVQAIDGDGLIAFQEDLDLDDLKRMDYRIIIETPAGGLEIGRPCTGSEREGCLEAQTELVPVSQASCEGNDRRVCFVPLGQVAPDLVRNLVKHYHDEYGLEIGVLTPSAVPAEMTNARREQIDGESLAEYLGTLFPTDFNDSNVALIGLTPLDLYANDRDWNFQLGHANWSEQSRAVVSSYRMHVGTFRLVDDERVFSRTRKLVTKYLGLMFYDLPPSDDARSPMYDNILSVTDLDRMEEPLFGP
jgi:predicted Zn-dependent protease